MDVTPGSAINDEFSRVWEAINKLNSEVFPEAKTDNWPFSEGTRLYAKDGRFYEVETLAPFRNAGICLTSYAIFQTKPQALEDFIKWCADSNIRVIRVMHWDGFNPDISNRVPKHVEGMNRLFTLAKKYKIFIWFTGFHKEKWSGGKDTSFGEIKCYDTLMSNRGSGIGPGQISNLWMYDDTLMNIVQKNQEDLLLTVNPETGMTWGGHIDLYTVANECLSTRFFIGDASILEYGNDPRTNLPNQTGAFFRTIYEFMHAFGLEGEKKLSLPKVREFQAWNGWRKYSEMVAHAKNIAPHMLVNCTSIFGDSKVSALMELVCGNWIDVHRYSTTVRYTYPDKSVVEFLDPLSDGSHYTNDFSLASIIAACKMFSLPVTIGEVSAVDESNRSKMPYFDIAPSKVLKVAAEMDVGLVTWYAAHSHEIGGPPADNEVYDAFRSGNFVDNFLDAAKKFNQTPYAERADVRQLTDAEAWGGRATDMDAPLLIPGMQEWAGDEAVDHKNVNILCPPSFGYWSN